MLKALFLRSLVGALVVVAVSTLALAGPASASLTGDLPSATAMASLAPAFSTPGAAFAWGSRISGQLGDGSEVGFSDVPEQIDQLGEVTAVSAGRQFGLALLGDGTVAAWGENYEGELGDGSRTNSEVPVAVSGLNEVKAISAGGDGLALLNDGTVRAWGSNGGGQLGNGSEEALSDVPVAVKNLSGVSAVSAGGLSNLALLENGTVMAWGFGYLGIGTASESDVPEPVTGLSEVAAISAGSSDGRLALLRNGTVMAWGYNEYGNLGDGTTTASDVPVPVSGLSEVTAVSAGVAHSLALLKNGTVMAWGANYSGELGDGTTTGPETCGGEKQFPCSRTPVAVSGLSGVVAVAAGAGFSLALLKNGTVMAWGNNYYGQLGDRSTAYSDVPVPVAGLTGATVISAGDNIGFGMAVAEPYAAPLPSVEKVEPDYGPPAGGTQVTITGTNFTGATEVEFGSASATSFKVESDTKITAVSPPGTGTVDVGVAAGGVLSATSAADQFRYVASVTKVEPAYGPSTGGIPVTITGTNFTGATEVEFGSSEATSFEVESDTKITAISPPGRGQVDVTVTTDGGISPTGSPDRFHYEPAITGVTPGYGSPFGGAQVTISGTNFTGATAVRFGADDAPSFKVKSSTEITAVAPAFAGGEDDVVGVYVTTPGGTNEYDECAARQVGFIYQPTITSIEPRSGPTAGGTEVTITGAALEGTIWTGGPWCEWREPVVRWVKFGSREATNIDRFVSPSEMTAVAPSGTGTVNVTVESAVGPSPAVPGDQFSYGHGTPGAPTVTGVKPDAGLKSGGTRVTITGSNLAGATEVDFGATAVSASCTETECTATSPRGAGTVDVTATTLDGTSATGPADQFTYVPEGPRPAVKALSTKGGPAAGGTAVTITGTSFAGITAVKFGSNAATNVVILSAASIMATSPASTTGTVDVTVTTPNGTNAPSSRDHFKYESPTVTGVTPNAGPTAGGTSVTIIGSGFAPGKTGTTFKFGKRPATSVECTSITTCTALAPAAAKPGIVDVRATVDRKTSATSTADHFTYS